MAVPKFPLIMGDGSQVRTLEELREHADLYTLEARYQDGALQRWLKAWDFQEEAAHLEELSSETENSHQALCAALGVTWTEQLEAAYQEAVATKDSEKTESPAEPIMPEAQDGREIEDDSSADFMGLTEKVADLLMTRQISGIRYENDEHVFLHHQTPDYIIETKNFCIAKERLGFDHVIIDKGTQSIDAALTKKYEKYLQYVAYSIEFEEDAVLVIESHKTLSIYFWEIKVGILNLASGEYRQLPIPKENCKILTLRGHYLLFSQKSSIYLYDFRSGKKKEIPVPENCKYFSDVGDIAGDTLYLLAQESWYDQVILFKIDLSSNMMPQRACVAYTAKNRYPAPEEIRVVGSSLWLHARNPVHDIDHLYRINLQSLQSDAVAEFYGENSQHFFFDDCFSHVAKNGELKIVNLTDGKVSVVTKEAYYLGVHKLWNWIYFKKEKGYDGVDYEHIYKIRIDQPNDIEMLDVKNWNDENA